MGSLASAGNAEFLDGVTPGVPGPRPSAFSGFEPTNLAARFTRAALSKAQRLRNAIYWLTPVLFAWLQEREFWLAPPAEAPQGFPVQALG